jgi:hypothetical protein
MSAASVTLMLWARQLGWEAPGLQTRPTSIE